MTFPQHRSELAEEIRIIAKRNPTGNQDHHAALDITAWLLKHPNFTAQRAPLIARLEKLAADPDINAEYAAHIRGAIAALANDDNS